MSSFVLEAIDITGNRLFVSRKQTEVFDNFRSSQSESCLVPLLRISNAVDSRLRYNRQFSDICVAVPFLPTKSLVCFEFVQGWARFWIGKQGLEKCRKILHGIFFIFFTEKIHWKMFAFIRHKIYTRKYENWIEKKNVREKNIKLKHVFTQEKITSCSETVVVKVIWDVSLRTE